ncbi:MAG: hypothetical protein RLT87_02120 [Gammaproteobacteria bacterium]
MIRILIFALVIALIIYMFRHHEKVKDNLSWIIGTYVIVVLLLGLFAIKNALDESEPVSTRAMNQSGQLIDRSPVMGDSPVKTVDTQQPVQYTRGASSLAEFLASSCPVDIVPDAERVKVEVTINGYSDINVSREELATAVWYLYRIQEKLLDIEPMPAFDIKLRVFRELVAYERLRQKTLLAVPHDQTGFAIGREKLAVALAQQTPEETLKAALHQSYHVLSYSLYGETFPWFQEGMAAYFENMKVETGMIILPENQAWVPMMTGSYSKFNINSIPLRELLTMSPRIFYDSKKDLHFAASHSFINFMLNHDEKGSELMKRYMRLLAKTRCNRPEPAAEFFEQLYPGGLKNLEQRWRKYTVPGNQVRYFEFETTAKVN